MRKLLGVLVVTAFALVVAPHVRADDDAKTILEKAVKAHGGKEKLAVQRSMYLRNQGTLDVPGVGELKFSQETWLQDTGKMKDQMQLDVNGMQINVTTVYNGEKIWISAAGNKMELDQEVYGKELKEMNHVTKVMRLAFVGDKDCETSIVGETKVEGRPAVGVRLAVKGHKDVTLYIDKETNLIVRLDRIALDSQTMQDVPEERIIKEYQEVNGVKTAKKIVINRDGKKFMEAEVLEVKFLDKIDDSEFAMP